MKKVHLLVAAILVFILTQCPLTIVAQQRAIIGVFKQGNYYTASEIPGGGFGRCFCGQAAYNCICGFVNFSDFKDPNIPVGQIAVVISSHVISGNTLEVKFEEKLRMDLKSNDFLQEEAVVINPEIAKSLGYKSIKILPGTYTIKNDNSILFNIEKGSTHTTRGWGWIGFVIVLIILASIISGQSSAPSGSTTSQNCDDCRRDMAWYNSLPNWKKALYHAWYITRWTICKARGCI
ncbi:MAG: hypothetical protein HUU34_22640 [Saprospiraceae bacterium]|jgi:hypothetical protein|nr:hypothetical protein [Saprospiraceae bacterium]